MAKHPETKNGFGTLRSSTEEIVSEHLRAAKQVSKRLKSKKYAREFLISAGILEKSGKGLAAPYR